MRMIMGNPFGKPNLKELFARIDRENEEMDRRSLELGRLAAKKKINTRKAPQTLVHKELVSTKTKGLDFILSDATPDRYDDIILTSGWELNNFNRNPIALFAHRSDF